MFELAILTVEITGRYRTFIDEHQEASNGPVD